MAIKKEDLVHFEDDSISDLLDQFAAHVRGNYDTDKEEQVDGFEYYKHHLKDNRDGRHTAFTMGITLHNSITTVPSTHGTWCASKDTEFLEWLALYHTLLGKLSGKIMRHLFNTPYLDLTNERHERYNPPFFGENLSDQVFFTSSQINHSSEATPLQGTEANAHCDSQDDELSYSLAINLSVIRSSTSLGWFWFTDYDTIIPLEPMSILIFSGTEEHQGSKMIHLANDPSPITLSYPRETRYNVICYPKKAIIRNRSPRVYVDQNFNESQQHPETNLLENAYYQFGGNHNYDNWSAREL